MTLNQHTEAVQVQIANLIVPRPQSREVGKATAHWPSGKLDSLQLLALSGRANRAEECLLGGKNGHDADAGQCLLMTLSGHPVDCHEVVRG